MRRTYCGHLNPDDYLFCGVCGSPLAEVMPSREPEAEAPELNTKSAVVRLIRNQESSPLDPLQPPGENPREEMASSERAATSDSVNSAGVRSHQERPFVSGPSMLGLDGPPTTSEVEYLLDEVPSHGPLKVLIFFAAVIVIAVLGWRQIQLRGGTPWLMAELHTLTSSKPAAQNPQSAQPSPVTTDTNANSAPAAAPVPPDPSQMSNPETSEGQKQAAKSANTTSTSPVTGIEPLADNTSTGSQSAVPQKPDQQSVRDQAPPPDHNANASSTEEAVERRPVAEPEPARSKPHTEIERASKITEPVSSNKDDETARLAEKYLYGDGVPQDCNRAVGLLGPAADSSNPKAETLLGAMYATGHCVPRDLPTSYRWFALALRQQPNNIWLGKNLESVWNQMNSSEKRLAMRMTNSARK